MVVKSDYRGLPAVSTTNINFQAEEKESYSVVIFNIENTGYMLEAGWF